MNTLEQRNYKIEVQFPMKMSADWSTEILPEKEKLTYRDFCKRYNLEMIPKFSSNTQN